MVPLHYPTITMADTFVLLNLQTNAGVGPRQTNSHVFFLLGENPDFIWMVFELGFS